MQEGCELICFWSRNEKNALLEKLQNSYKYLQYVIGLQKLKRLKRSFNNRKKYVLLLTL